MFDKDILKQASDFSKKKFATPADENQEKQRLDYLKSFSKSKSEIESLIKKDDSGQESQ